MNEEKVTEFKNITHIAHAFMVEQNGWKYPMFETADGRKFYPDVTPTGSCWVLSWSELTEEEAKDIKPPEFNNNQDGESKIKYVLIGALTAMIAILFIIVYGYGLIY